MSQASIVIHSDEEDLDPVLISSDEESSLKFGHRRSDVLSRNHGNGSSRNHLTTSPVFVDLTTNKQNISKRKVSDVDRIGTNVSAVLERGSRKSNENKTFRRVICKNEKRRERVSAGTAPTPPRPGDGDSMATANTCRSHRPPPKMDKCLTGHNGSKKREKEKENILTVSNHRSRKKIMTATMTTPLGFPKWSTNNFPPGSTDSNDVDMEYDQRNTECMLKGEFTMIPLGSYEYPAYYSDISDAEDSSHEDDVTITQIQNSTCIVIPDVEHSADYNASRQHPISMETDDFVTKQQQIGKEPVKIIDRPSTISVEPVYSDISDDELPDLHDINEDPVIATKDVISQENDHRISTEEQSREKQNASRDGQQRSTSLLDQSKVLPKLLNKKCFREQLRSVCKHVARTHLPKANKNNDEKLDTKIKSCHPSKRDNSQRHFLDALIVAPSPEKRARLESLDSVELVDDNECSDVFISIDSSEDSDIETDTLRSQTNSTNLIRSESIESIELYKDGEMLPSFLEVRRERVSIDLSPPGYLLRRSPSESSLESVKLYHENGDFVTDDSKSELDSLASEDEQDKDEEDDSQDDSDARDDDVLQQVTRPCGRVVRGKTRNVFDVQENENESQTSARDSKKQVSESQRRRRSNALDQPLSSLTRSAQITQRNACIRSLPDHPTMVRTEDSARIIQMFSEDFSNAIDACKEESDRLVEHASTMTRDFTTASRCPQPDDIRYILEDILLSSKNRVRSHRAYEVLKHIQNLHPPFAQLPFDWDFMESLVDGMNLKEDRSTDGESLHVFNRILAFSYVVSAIDSELVGHSFRSQRQVSRALVTQWFSVENHFGRVKKLIAWISDVISNRYYNSLTPAFLKSHSKNMNGGSAYLPRKGHHDLHSVLLLLQKCVELSLVVCRDPLAAAVRLVPELVSLYQTLPSLSHKRLLLETISSPLLREKATQQILDDFCGSDMVPLNLSGPLSMQDIVNHYFVIQPRAICVDLTPPPSPASHRHEDDEVPHHQGSPPSITSDSCDEIVFLISVLVESYVDYSSGKLHRCLSSQNRCISWEDLSALTHRHIDSLKARLTEQCHGHLTSRAQLSLAKLYCLSGLEKL